MEDNIWEWWFSNGQLMKRGKYKNGKKRRWSEWYENGKLASSFGYMDDKPNGKCLKNTKMVISRLR